MAKAQSPVATTKPSKGNGKAPAGKVRAAERPPESAEDFAHVIRRLITARNGRAEKS